MIDKAGVRSRSILPRDPDPDRDPDAVPSPGADDSDAVLSGVPHPVPDPDNDPDSDSDSGMDPVAERFVDRLGHLFELDGLPHIAGRIFGWLLLSPGPQSLEELAVALRVSKGSVSQDTRLLERIGALERVTRPGDRRVYYQAGDHLSARMLELRLERFRRTREVLQEGLSAPAAANEQVAARLRDVVGFFDRLIDVVSESRAAVCIRDGGAEERER
jgi:DNA-binding transcriptional regulator GbsR (MarR family)